MATLPNYQRTIDTAFINTWDKIRPEVADNVLNSEVVWAALRDRGCFKKQVGGRRINRTVKYALPTPKAVGRGDLFGQGIVETKTMAQWTWRFLSAHIQRDIYTDQENAGEFEVRDYLKDRMQEARQSLTQQYETDIQRAGDTTESGKQLQGLNDLVPTFATRATGTYGALSRANSWWQCKYRQLTAPYDVNLLADMRNLYNTVGNNQEFPNLLLCDQTMFELYEDYAEDKAQIVRDTGSKLADLGFEVLRYKGKPLVWSANTTTQNMLFLNTNHIEVVYDPRYFFKMGDFKNAGPLTEEYIAHILCCLNIITDSPRRHGRLYP